MRFEKRRRRFALPAHSKSLHAFRSLGRQANIDFRFATSGFGVTARDILLELIDAIYLNQIRHLSRARYQQELLACSSFSRGSEVNLTDISFFLPD